MEGNKFETWLRSIIQPGEHFYPGGNSEAQLADLIERTAAIGYEGLIAEAFVINYRKVQMQQLPLENFSQHADRYTIVDVSNTLEVKEKKIFQNRLTTPLAEIRNRVAKIPTDKPVVVHCAGGYRSVAASSLLQSKLHGKAVVYDLSENIKLYDADKD